MKSPIDIVRGRIVDIDKHGIVTIKARYWRAVGAYQRKRVGSSPFLSVGRGHHRRSA